MKPTEFSKGMMLLFSTFGKEPSDIQMEAYRIVLGDVPSERWAETIKTALSTCKFMPAPATILEIANPPKIKDPALMLKEIRKAFLKYGRNKEPQWTDPAIGYAVEAAGGWVNLCSLDEGNYQKYTVPALVKSYLTTTTEIARI